MILHRRKVMDWINAKEEPPIIKGQPQFSVDCVILVQKSNNNIYQHFARYFPTTKLWKYMNGKLVNGNVLCYRRFYYNLILET